MRQYYGFGERQGIKAVSKRGTFGVGWLARAWCDLLDDLGPYSAATKGRTVARGQHVQSISVRPGIITGLTSDYSLLYRAEIRLEPLSEARWERVISAIKADPLVVAQLLGGHLPETMRPIIEQYLLPKRADAFNSTCGCYYWETLCKHAAGILYLVGEELDRDPLLLFTLRGMPSHELFARLSPLALPAPADAPPPMPESEPLPTDPAAFWQGNMPPLGEIATAAAASSAPIPLNPFPFWAGSRPFEEAIADYTSRAAQRVRAMQEGTEE